MAGEILQRAGGVWALAGSQHGVVTRAQLLELGFSAAAIEHRVRKGRLHAVHAGVYSVGRPELTRYGRWMAVVLACGERAILSHASAAALWGIRDVPAHAIEVSVPAGVARQLAEMPRRPGLAIVRAVLDRHTFTLTDSELERLFVPLALAAGLPRPETQRVVNGFRVDFWWPDLGLVVECDGLRYHRTPAQQSRDRLRDQTHTAAGLTPLRFTHSQVKFEPERVRNVLATVAARLIRSQAGRAARRPPASRAAP